MVEKKQEITPIIEYFKSLRDEIHLRIREHTRLVWIKLIVLGGIISFLIATFYGKEPSTSPLFYIFWIIPVAAIIFDMLIAGNLRVINNLGYYIKNYVEGEAFAPIKDSIQERYLFDISKDARVTEEKLRSELKRELKDRGFSLCGDFQIEKDGNEWKVIDKGREFTIKEGKKVYFSKFGFWEEKAAQATPEYHCYTWEDMLAIWLFTLGSWVFSLLLRRHMIGSFGALGGWDIFLAAICGVGVGFVLYFLLRSITMERRF